MQSTNDELWKISSTPPPRPIDCLTFKIKILYILMEFPKEKINIVNSIDKALKVPSLVIDPNR